MYPTKIQKSYTDYSCGFAIQILNAPMEKIYGEWVLAVNYNALGEAVISALSTKPARLTGCELRFIRHFFDMDLKSFGRRFGNVAHSAVIKWEKFGDDPTNMNWATEKDIRLAIVDKVNPALLRRVYRNLAETAPSKPYSIQIDSSRLKKAA